MLENSLPGAVCAVCAVCALSAVRVLDGNEPEANKVWWKLDIGQLAARLARWNLFSAFSARNSPERRETDLAVFAVRQLQFPKTDLMEFHFRLSR